MSIPVGTVIHVSSGADRYTFIIDKLGMRTLRVNDRTWGKKKPALPSWSSIKEFIAAVPFRSDISISMTFPNHLLDFTDAVIRRNAGESWETTYGAVIAKQREIYDSVAATYCLTLSDRPGFPKNYKWNFYYSGIYKPFSFQRLASAPPKQTVRFR